jgi:hypothetical protein
VAFAKHALQKFGDVEAAHNALKAALREQVGAMQDQIDDSRIRSAVFALRAIGMGKGDRKMCLDRLKAEEQRLNQGMIGTMTGGRTGPTVSITHSACSSSGSGNRRVSAPSLKHESRFWSLWKRSSL